MIDVSFNSQPSQSSAFFKFGIVFASHNTILSSYCTGKFVDGKKYVFMKVMTSRHARFEMMKIDMLDSTLKIYIREEKSHLNFINNIWCIIFMGLVHGEIILPNMF